jgi:hypothetical protein
VAQAHAGEALNFQTPQSSLETRYLHSRSMGSYHLTDPDMPWLRCAIHHSLFELWSHAGVVFLRLFILQVAGATTKSRRGGCGDNA